MRDLVVRRFHLESHALEDIDDRASRIFAEICRRQIEVRADVVRNRGRLLIRTWLEHEELCFHASIHRVAELGGARDRFFENAARVSGERLAVRSVDVADQPRDAVLLVTPRKDLEGAEVRREEHV